jgi:importin-4
VQAGLKEDDAKARHAESRVIAAIASIDWDDGEWPELTPALFNLATNSNASQREIGTYIIFTVLETNPTAFNDHVPKLLELFGRTLRDPESSDVRINTMLSIGAMLMLIDTEEDKDAVESLQNLIPPMVEVLKDAIQQEDEEKIQHAFEVFQQFLAYESTLMSKHLKNLVQFMLDLAANTDADDDVRSQALAFLAQTVRYRRMKIQAMKDMGAQLTLKSMDILTEIDDDEEDEAMSPARSALALLDQLASDLPPRMILVPLLDAFPRFAASEEPGRRKAGILALGACVEGAPDFVATQLKTILPPIIALLNDANIDVRHDALVGLSRIAEEIAEELASEHEALMTALAKNLQAAMTPASDEKSAKKNAAIIRSACGALDSLTEGFSADIMKRYAPRLVESLQSLLDYDDPKVKSAAAGAIGAIAEALDEDFKPYFEKTVQSLGQYLTIKESEDDLVLRSGVCDAMGRIATAVGAEAFQPYVMPLMRSSEEALNLDDSRLKESSFILWSALAKVYEHDFAEFLPGVFKGLSASLELEEEEVTLELTEEEQGIIAGAQEMITAGKKVKLRTTNPAEEVDDMEEDEDDEADWDDIMGVSTEALEKEVAIEVLGDIISHAWGPAEVTEYLEKAIEQVTPLIEHSYEGCRKAAIGTLWRAYARVWQLWEEETGSSWTPGYPPKQTPSAPLLKLGEIVSTATLSMWADEADRYVQFSSGGSSE